MKDFEGTIFQIADVAEGTLLHKRVYFDRNAPWMRDVGSYADGMLEVSGGYYTEDRESTATPAELHEFSTISKICEVVSEEFLRVAQPDRPKVDIDFTVVPPELKNWRKLAADIPSPGRGYPDIHVKSCKLSTITKFEQKSWMFQIVPEDPIFQPGHEGDVVIFAYMAHKDLDWVEITAAASWREIRPLLYLPISKRLQDMKRCVYYNRLYAAVN